MYRILSAQYLLKHIQLEEDENVKIQETILSLSQDNELDYDLRADAADLLLNLGTDKYKTLGREIIQMLGRIEGNVKTIYDNKQNVHTEEIEKSILNIIETLYLLIFFNIFSTFLLCLGSYLYNVFESLTVLI